MCLCAYVLRASYVPHDLFALDPYTPTCLRTYVPPDLFALDPYAPMRLCAASLCGPYAPSDLFALDPYTPPTCPLIFLHLIPMHLRA